MTGPETDLARIEAALAEGRVTADDPRERELQELALALRADSPEPGPAFATAMDRRMAEGFGKTKARRRMSLPSFFMPALAGAAVLILVAVVAISSIGGSADDGTVASSSEQPKDAAGGLSGIIE